MADLSAQLTWKGDMKLESKGGSGHSIEMDAADIVGGHNTAGRPKEMVVHGLIGCTAMDVLSILKKMRVEFDSFEMTADVSQTSEHPKVFSEIHLVYSFTGTDIPLEKVRKAVKLSQEQYCGVSAMLRTTANITSEIKLNEESFTA